MSQVSLCSRSCNVTEIGIQLLWLHVWGCFHFTELHIFRTYHKTLCFSIKLNWESASVRHYFTQQIRKTYIVYSIYELKLGRHPDSDIYAGSHLSTVQRYLLIFVISGDFKAHPKDLIVAPCWLKAFKGNELQRLIRKKMMVGDRMMTLERHNLEKRIRFLYRRFNRTGKHR